MKVKIEIFNIFLSIFFLLCSANAAEIGDSSDTEPKTIPMPSLQSTDLINEVRIQQGPRQTLVTTHQSVFIYGAPYSSLTNGEYKLQPGLVNGYPVYQKQGGGYTWSFYQRSNRKWYLDFDEPDEDWSGTVMDSTAVGDQPDLLEYANHGAVAISDTVLSRRVAYCNDGLFKIQTTLYNNRPVYQCNSNPDMHMFRRESGLWVVTFGNQITETYADGTVAYTVAPSIVPYGVDWS